MWVCVCAQILVNTLDVNVYDTIVNNLSKRRVDHVVIH